jgi:cytochrome c oxidase accessory protein FixG
MFLLILFFTIPFIRIHDQPLILFNIFERRFIILGKVFWPQDFHLFVIGLITLIIGIIFFTVIYGRVWCGWTCPQTIFLEMVFRKIEFLIEGNAARQRKLDNAELSFEKVWKKTLKHILFVLLSVVIVHTFITYIIGWDELKNLMNRGPGANFGAFLAIFIFTLVFYFVFARFREQVCTLVCPYGRLQGVMLDPNSLVVAYDFRRGEERGRWKKSEDRRSIGKGDCIDCHHCVTVCPTGIDIRNGTQLECINCTACIDACNNVMRRIGFKPGLIRIASSNEIAEGRKFRITPRIIAYTILLLGLIALFIALFAMRNDTETTILRVPGTLYQQVGNEISNVYNVKIINKSNRDFTVEIKPLTLDGRIQLIGKPIELKSQEITEAVFLLYIPRENVTSAKIPVTFGLFDHDELIEKEKATFVGPL